MTEIFDIVQLMEKSAVTRLSKDYEGKLLNKIKDSFTSNEQQLFATSFYGFLNFDSKKDFVIDFDDAWKWMGYTRKDNAKSVLKKHFIEEVDYKVKFLLLQPQEQKDADGIDVETRGGSNKEEIFLTINTFKKFCLKSGTKKADEVHDYFIKLEELLHETLDEESKELRNQLESVERKFGDLHEKHFKLEENHKRILYKRVKHTLKRGGCVYIIKDRNKEVTEDGTCDYVFGNCKNLQSREQTYYTYLNPELAYVMFTPDYLFMETCVKKKYKKNLKSNERIDNVNLEEMIDLLESTAKLLSIEYTSHRNEEELYEDKEDEDKEDEEKEDDEIIDEEDETKEAEIITKKCTKCLETRDISSFNKDKSRKGGYHSSCKICEKETKKQYKNKKDAEFVPLTEKRCSLCEQVKEIAKFSKHLYNKDGYVNNCLDCCQEITNKARKNDKEKGIRYKCNNCFIKCN